MEKVRIKDIAKGVWELWKEVCVSCVTGTGLLLVVFGGRCSLSINFNTLKELIEAIGRYFKWFS